jgi:bacillithiol synthase
VILDAVRPALMEIFAPIVKLELSGYGVAKPVKATTAALENLGFKAQIMPRDINLFYLGEGGRSLIDATEGGYKLKDSPKTWTETEILAELASSPENFSPNVALRPVYQETLLPNLAYIGGWAEVSYWMQLKAGFEAVGCPFPLLVPRLHATLFTAAQATEFQELGFLLSDIVQPLHLLNDQFLLQNWNPAPLDTAILEVDRAFDQLAGMVASIDPTLATGIRAEQTRSNNAFETLQKKVRKSLRNRNPLPYQRIAALKNAIEPENASQQRVLNFTAFDSIDPLTLVEVIINNARKTNSEAKWINLP